MKNFIAILFVSLICLMQNSFANLPLQYLPPLTVKAHCAPMKVDGTSICDDKKQNCNCAYSDKPGAFGASCKSPNCIAAISQGNSVCVGSNCIAAITTSNDPNNTDTAMCGFGEKCIGAIGGNPICNGPNCNLVSGKLPQCFDYPGQSGPKPPCECMYDSSQQPTAECTEKINEFKAAWSKWATGEQ